MSRFAPRTLSLLGASLVAVALTLVAAPSAQAQASTRPGMGAEPYTGGTMFRTWAPNANSVHVAGSFNGWSSTATPLTSEGNGNWSRDVTGALIGDQYLYVIRNGTQTLWKPDPRARQMTNSVGNSIIRSGAYDWNSGTTTTILTEGFNGTTLPSGWTFSKTNNGRYWFSTGYKYEGTRGIVLDCSPTGTYSYTRLDRTLNLSGKVGATLQFRFRNIGDELQSANEGVYISTNGTTWYKTNWNFPSQGSTWHLVTIDLGAEAARFGLSLTSSFRIRFQQYDDYAAASDGVAIDAVVVTAVNPAPTYNQPGFNEMNIYEMHIGTYNDTPGGGPGNFQSAIAKLQHVQDLAFNMVKVMPIAEFGADFSWGYNPAHLFAPESAYGSPDDAKAFVKAAHARGIGVILDVVHNHYGPSDLGLWRYDGWGSGDKGGIYFYNDWRAYTPWGATRPDYGRGEVRTFIRDNALYWLNEYRMDGLRWDSTVNIRTQNNGSGGDIPDGWSLMQWVNNEVDASTPWKIMIAEDLQNNEWITKTTGSGGTGFDSQWDAGFVHPIRQAIITGSDSNRDMWAVRNAVARWYNGSHTQRVIYTESHDEVNNGHSRVPEEIWPGNASSWYSKKRSTLGAGLVFTSPGIPMIFMGQEMLEDGFWSDTDPLDWAKATTYAGIVSLYRDLARLRRNWYNNTRGLRANNCNVHHVNNTNKVIAFHRWNTGGAGDDVVVVANFSGTGFSSYNIGFPRSGTWNVRFNSDWNGYDGSFGNWNSYNTTANSGAKDGMSFNGNVGIGPYSLIILSQ